MPLLFSYGTLQQEDVQFSTFGRLLSGRRDELPGFESSLGPIAGPQFSAATGKTHHDNITMTANTNSSVPGTVFEVTDSELASADEYEAPFSYQRVIVKLASGKEAWVYVHGHSSPDAG